MKISHFILIIVTLLFLASCAGRTNHYDWQCDEITVGAGPEDFEIHTYNNGETWMIISSVHRGFFGPYGNGKLQAVLIADNGMTTSEVKDINIVGDVDGWVLEDPVGMSLVFDVDEDEWLLYVINNAEKNYIERFILTDEPEKIKRISPIKDIDQNMLVAPNDILALTNGELYVSNPFNKKKSIVHYDPKTKEWNESGKPNAKFANGIALDDKNRIYIADFWKGFIHVFERDENNGELSDAVCKIEIPNNDHPDNLLWSTDNTKYLNIAAHQSKVSTFLHLYLRVFDAPSSIYQINTESINLSENGECTYQINTLYEDDGSQISASSTAVIRNNRLYISQLKDNHIFECRINEL